MKKYAISGTRGTLHKMDPSKPLPNQQGNFIEFSIEGFAVCGKWVFPFEATDDPTQRGTDGIIKARRRCRNCEKKGGFNEEA